MIKDAFNQGRLAFQHNHPMSACEYPVGSSLRAEWMSGWTTASNSLPHRELPATSQPSGTDRTSGATH